MFIVNGVFTFDHFDGKKAENPDSWNFCLCVMHGHTGGFATAMSSVAKGHHKFQNLRQQCS